MREKTNTQPLCWYSYSNSNWGKRGNLSKGKGEVVELGGDEGVEQGNSLKKHYVTKECMTARRLRGQGLTERKRVLLEQIWLLGRLMEGLFSLLPVWPIRLYGSV